MRRENLDIWRNYLSSKLASSSKFTLESSPRRGQPLFLLPLYDQASDHQMRHMCESHRHVEGPKKK